MSNKIASSFQVFRPSDCNEAIICSPAHLGALRKVADCTVAFARAVDEGKMSGFAPEVARIEAISDAYNPKSLQQASPSSDMKLLPLNVANQFLQGDGAVVNIVRHLGGAKQVEAKQAWRDLRSVMKEFGHLVRALHQTANHMKETQNGICNNHVVSAANGRREGYVFD